MIYDIFVEYQALMDECGPFGWCSFFGVNYLYFNCNPGILCFVTCTGELFRLWNRVLWVLHKYFLKDLQILSLSRRQCSQSAG
jgi:hypothetical protein